MGPLHVLAPAAAAVIIGVLSIFYQVAALSLKEAPASDLSWIPEGSSGYRAVQITPEGLPFLLRATPTEPPEAKIAAVAIQKALKQEARAAKRAEWISGFKASIFRLPFPALRRKLRRRLEAYKEAESSFKTAMGIGVTRATLGGFYGFGGLVGALALPFRAIAYTVASGFRALMDSSKNIYNARIAVMRAEKDQAQKFVNAEVQQTAQSHHVIQLIERLSKAIVAHLIPADQLRLDLRVTDMQLMKAQVVALYRRFKNEVKTNKMLRTVAQGEAASSFFGRVRRRFVYRRTLLKNAEQHLFTAFVVAVQQASFIPGETMQGFNSRTETATNLVDLLFQMTDQEDKGQAKATENFLRLHQGYLEEKTINEIASSLASTVVAQRYEMISLLQQLSRQPGRLLSPDDVRQACRGPGKYVDAASVHAGFPVPLDTRLDYFVYIYRAPHQDPELELQRCVSAQNIYRLVGQRNFFVPRTDSTRDKRPKFDIGDFRLVKGSLLLSKVEDPDTVMLRLINAVSGYLYNTFDSDSLKQFVKETLLDLNYIPISEIPEKSSSFFSWRRAVKNQLLIIPSCVAQKLSSTGERPQDLTIPVLGEDTWKEVFEQCGFELTPVSRLRRFLRIGVKRGFAGLLQRVRVNTGVFRGSRVFHDAAWRALRLYLGGEDLSTEVSGLREEFFPQDPTFAYLNSVFAKIVADSGIEAFSDANELEPHLAAESASFPLKIQPVTSNHLYTPAEAPEAWRAAMWEQLDKLVTASGRLRIVVSDRVRISACRALKRLHKRYREDEGVIDEVLRYFGLQGPHPPVRSLVCSRAPANADPSAETVFATNAFPARGTTADGSLPDPMAPFRLFVERALAALDGGAQLPFVIRFLLEGEPHLFQMHSVVARPNVETMRGYEAETMLKLAKEMPHGSFEAVLERMKGVFMKMFDIEVVGLRHKTGADCFFLGAPWAHTGLWGSSNSLFEVPEESVFAPKSSLSPEDCISGGRDGETFVDAVNSAVQQWISQGFSHILFNENLDDQALQTVDYDEMLSDKMGDFQALGDQTRTVFRDMVRIQQNPALLKRAHDFLQKYFGDPNTPPPPNITRFVMLKALATEGKDGFFDGFQSNALIYLIWKHKDLTLAGVPEGEDPMAIASKLSQFEKSMISPDSLSLPLRYTVPFPLMAEQQIKRQGFLHRFMYRRFYEIPNNVIFFSTIGATACLAGGPAAPLCASIFFKFSPLYGSQIVGAVGLLIGATISLVKVFKWYIYSSAQLAVQHILWGSLQVAVGSATAKLLDSLPADSKLASEEAEKLALIDESGLPFLRAPSTPTVVSEASTTVAPSESQETDISDLQLENTN
ncbi:hypothetical protein BESB_018470 [Besnoitia besnoiti]|uniref:Transmembrane protein n=1 Tax=Besnoitia besnoiti TaxID=94643 RepID=A0A2A9M3L0_BESBE|nr:hypothetical protein BESB_018470 [Besnoitia besnoiti]PFH32529.1 hypothetical protein BESB_018470 [Besnoitia besnoiti]